MAYTAPVSASRATGVRETLQSLWQHYGPKEKRVDGHVIPSGPNHLCEVWWMVRDLAVDRWNQCRGGFEEMPGLLLEIAWRACFAMCVVLACACVVKLVEHWGGL